MIVDGRFQPHDIAELTRQLLRLLTLVPRHHLVPSRLLLLLLLLLFLGPPIYRVIHLSLEFRIIALDVFLEELAAEGEVLEEVIVAVDGVEVGDEVFAVEVYEVVVEVDLREGLDVGVHVQRDVRDRCLIEKLHQETVVLEVGRTLHEVVEG